MNRIKIFLLAALLVVAAGCEDFLDINRDPNNPSEPNIQQLLPGIQNNIGSIFVMDFGAVGYASAVFTHQLSTRQPEYDNYGILGSSFAVNNYWVTFYADVLQDVDLLIKLGEETDNSYYAGIGKVLKAYMYSTLVDLYGDVPFSEANVKGNTNPVFENGVDIYPQLFQLLDDAIADFANDTSANVRAPGVDDLIYTGSITNWEKAANTIKLKLYTQVRLVDGMFNQAAVNALLATPANLINSWAESFIIPYGTGTAPDDRNLAFIAEYGGGQISNYISPWFYETMNGESPEIFEGIVDPRIPYYFANQNRPPENDPEYMNGNFISIYFGSTGTNRDHAGRATFTMMGIYPAGGKFDDGSVALDADGRPTPLGTDHATGAAPCRLLTYADRLYLEAELIAVGKATGNLRDVTENAIQASFLQVDQVVEMVDPGSARLQPQDVPELVGSGDDEAYIEDIMTAFDAASADGKLEIVMTQKWISSWGASHDQYTDYRRTGYPVIFDPNNALHAPGGFVSGGPDGSGAVPVQRTREYPLSWPWSNDELTLNTSAPDQKTISTYSVFWDN